MEIAAWVFSLSFLEIGIFLSPSLFLFFHSGKFHKSNYSNVNELLSLYWNLDSFSFILESDCCFWCCFVAPHPPTPQASVSWSKLADAAEENQAAANKCLYHVHLLRKWSISWWFPCFPSTYFLLGRLSYLLPCRCLVANVSDWSWSSFHCRLCYIAQCSALHSV